MQRTKDEMNGKTPIDASERCASESAMDER